MLSQADSSGRLLLFKALIREENYTIANIYGPNKDAEAGQFYHTLSNLLRTNDFGKEENTIMGGDFNCPLNINLDKKGGIQIPQRHVVKCIEEIQDDLVSMTFGAQKIQIKKVSPGLAVLLLYFLD